jgi:hypothetical protein
VLLGRCGEAAHRFLANARLAREVGDDMALVGGDSLLRHLVADDVDGARALLARKEAILARGGEARGGLHEIVRVERWLLALYRGRGAELLDGAWSRDAFGWTFFDPAALRACAALQSASHSPRQARRVLRRSIARLAQDTAAPAAPGMAAHLRASLHALDGDTPRALAELSRAAERYTAADMLLHAALVRLRRGRLAGDPAGGQLVQDAERELRACGLARPEAWAHMLVPVP